MTKTVVFDLGGVLINWDPRNLYRKMFNDQPEMERFLATVCTQEWNRQQDAGRALSVAIEERIGMFPQHEVLIRAFYDRWDEMLDGSNAGTVEILRELCQKNLPVYALTNWSAETFPAARDRFDFLQWFDGITVSGEEKMLKPDIGFFQVLLDRYDLRAGNLIFIDDSIDNVQAARGMGMVAIHYQSHEALREELLGQGVLGN